MDRLDDALQSQASAFVNDTATWVDPAGRTLSDRIWNQKAEMRAAIDQIIQDGILRGDTVEQVSETLLTYVRPSYARYGGGKARHAAERLAGHEMRRSYALGTQQVAMSDPAGGYLRYSTSSGHSEADECDDRANHDEGFGRGVYPAKECPLPPEHVGCKCTVSEVGPDTRDMNAYVEQLRVEYGLDQEPDDLTPDDLVIYRRETQKVKDAVVFLFNAWFEQVGLVSRDQLMLSSPSVREWVADVAAEKARRARE